MSLKVPEFETLHDAKQRLEGTVVMYDNEPVYITRVIEAEPDEVKPDIFRVIATPLPLNMREDPRDLKFRKYISSGKFDLATIPMGFLNYEGKALYCTRIPRRQYKQGISETTLSVESLGEKREYALNTPKLSRLVREKSFVEMIKGKYPSFAECILQAQNGGSYAFSRHFAVSVDEDLDGLVYLYHKTEKVGFIYEEKVKLAKTMRCLEEALRELDIRV